MLLVILSSQNHWSWVVTQIRHWANKEKQDVQQEQSVQTGFQTFFSPGCPCDCYLNIFFNSLIFFNICYMFCLILILHHPFPWADLERVPSGLDQCSLDLFKHNFGICCGHSDQPFVSSLFTLSLCLLPIFCKPEVKFQLIKFAAKVKDFLPTAQKGWEFATLEVNNMVMILL